MQYNIASHALYLFIDYNLHIMYKRLRKGEYVFRSCVISVVPHHYY